MTFCGFGFHEYRERWIHQEWFWFQTPANLVDPLEILTKEDAQDQLQKRTREITPYLRDEEQSELGRMFEALADLTNEVAAFAEMQDLGLL